MNGKLQVQLILSGTTAVGGRNGALSRPRRVQRRNTEGCSHVLTHSLRPLNTGGDSALRRTTCRPTDLITPASGLVQRNRLLLGS